MSRSDLARRLAAELPHLYGHEIEAVINAIQAVIAEALARGEEVTLKDFGRWRASRRPGGEIPCPTQPGATMRVPPHRRVIWAASPRLRRLLQAGTE